MLRQRDKACGADIHKKTIVATILSSDGTKVEGEFGTTVPELIRFKEWLKENDCNTVAVESTGTFWQPIYSVLEGSVEVIVANPYMIKHMPGRKTDKVDSNWIAQLCLNGMIEPSRIFPKADRELRRLTRARESLGKIRTQLKNSIHKDLDSSHIKLSSVISDIFGKSGMHIIRGLLDGQELDFILKGIPSGRVKKKADQIKEAIHNNLELTQVILIESSLSLIYAVEQQINMIEAEIASRIMSRQEDLEIATSIPGVDFISGATLLAEIGNYRNFSSPEKMAAYFGIVPSVSQSAGRLHTGSITKHGSKHMRWILVQIANAASKKIGSKLRRFYLRIKSRSGHNVAIIALARKILCILHHLLMNGEKYVEDDGSKKSRSKRSYRTSSPRAMDIQEMIDIIRQSGYEVQRVDTSEGAGLKRSRSGGRNIKRGAYG
jgi:transposase